MNNVVCFRRGKKNKKTPEPAAADMTPAARSDDLACTVEWQI